MSKHLLQYHIHNERSHHGKHEYLLVVFCSVSFTILGLYSSIENS
jgi:hypothetical protein